MPRSHTLPAAPSMPPECLERIVSYAAKDHRVLSTLMQVNSTLFRMATPYLYREPFQFIFGDEFQLDWDTESWSRHLRAVRHAKLLLLYLTCTDTVQAQLGRGRVQRGTSLLSPSADLTVPKEKYSRKWHRPPSAHAGGSQSTETCSLSPPAQRPQRSQSQPLPLEIIPARLEKLLTAFVLPRNHPTPANTAGTHGFRTVNYLDYVEHLDLDRFLTSSIQTLFSTPFANADDKYSVWEQSQIGSLKGCYLQTTERTFVERVLFRSTAPHVTTLSISVATFARLQRDLMEHVLDSTPVSLTPSTPVKQMNSVGVQTGAPLSQLARLNISGLHTSLKPKVLRAIRWFVRCHVARYPDVLREVAFEGPGDKVSSRRRQRNRNVVHSEPVQPGVVHFNHQDQAEDGLGGGGDGLNEMTGDGMALQVEDPQGVHFADVGDTINGLFNVYGVPMEAVPADFHSQYYLLAQNPDESSATDILGIVQELRGQLEVLDLSRWSWGVVSQQALDLIPTQHLTTLKFHPRTRIQCLNGPLFLSKCPRLKTLDIHAFDANLLRQDCICSSTAGSSPEGALLSALSLTGTVLNVLPVTRDAIQHTGKSLESIELSASLDGFLSERETIRLMDWSTSLSGFTTPHLATLRLHGHVALMFNVPFLLELCPTLRQFALNIKSYTSSSFVNADLAHVLRRFMVPLDQNQMDMQAAPKFRLDVLDLEGPWILTDRDMDQIALQITGLTHLSLVDCRIYSSTCTDDGQDEDPTGCIPKSLCSPVVRLVERAQSTLRVLQIHRRCLEGNLQHCQPCPPYEPVLAFKEQFPHVKLIIRERQNENSYVLAPSVAILRRIQHPMSRRRTLSIQYSGSMGRQHLHHPRLYEEHQRRHQYSAWTQAPMQSSSWWRATDVVVPFLKSFRRQKCSSRDTGFEGEPVRSWRGTEGGQGRRKSLSNMTLKFFGSKRRTSVA
ncbi:hypothetical protein EC968_002166 [Mortierella alpina]|nr:hypothetical protein EC968_002166 [Mortierella alpina]